LRGDIVTLNNKGTQFVATEIVEKKNGVDYLSAKLTEYLYL
jgi:hypothetical protein